VTAPPGAFARAGLDWIVPDWDAPPQVRAFFTTRNGLSGRPFDVGPASLDALDDAARAAVLASRATVASLLPSSPVYLEQVHGADVATVEALPSPSSPWPVADAAVTRAVGVVLAVRVADCLPVLFSDAQGTVVAAAHAGWRGLAAGVLESTVKAMAVAAGDVRAWIGPGIGPRSFEVGQDVRDAFVARNRSARARFVPRADGKWLADLPALARDRLDAAGVPRVWVSDACTFEDAKRFFSFRRDRDAGRMAAYVWRVATSTG
jgi:YfiH family protein